MKKFLLAVFILLFSGFIGFSGCTFADSGYITTSAESKTELVPDIVSFNIEIVTTSKESMEKAAGENRKICTKVYENLEKSSAKADGGCIKTLSYGAISMYKYTNGKKEFDYYQVTNKIYVRTKKISEAGGIIDTAIADGASSVSGISYDVSDYESECNKLLAETSKKAKEQAESIAKSIGSEIVGIKSLEGNCSASSQNIAPRMLRSAKTVSCSESDESTNIEQGTVTLNAKVIGNFYLK